MITRKDPPRPSPKTWPNLILTLTLTIVLFNCNVHLQEMVHELDKLEQSLEGISEDTTTAGDSGLPKSLLVAESDTCSLTSDLVSNPDADVGGDSGVEDIDEAAKPEKNEKLRRLKHMFQDQFKDLSLDTMILAGAQAASQVNMSNPMIFSPASNMNSAGASRARSAVYSNRPVSPLEIPRNDKPGSPSELSVSGSRNDESVGSWEDGESDSEGRCVYNNLIFIWENCKFQKCFTVWSWSECLNVMDKIDYKSA